MTARVEKVVTSGRFELDGGSWEVDNNVWLLGDDDEVLIVDAGHDADAIVAAVGDRRVVGVVCTHGHNDHVNAAVDVARATGAPTWLPPDDRMLWDAVHDVAPDETLRPHTRFTVSNTAVEAIHTPGHTPGSTCLYVPDLDVVFTGDTLFAGGPGATGRSFSSFEDIIDSIRERVLTLPAHTRVHTGHGEDTFVERESPQLREWIARGH